MFVIGTEFKMILNTAGLDASPASSHARCSGEMYCGLPLRIVDGCRKRECGELLALYVDETGAIALRAGAGDAAEIERLFAETEPRIGAPERDLQRHLTDSWSHRESRSHRN